MTWIWPVCFSDLVPWILREGHRHSETLEKIFRTAKGPGVSSKNCFLGCGLHYLPSLGSSQFSEFCLPAFPWILGVSHKYPINSSAAQASQSLYLLLQLNLVTRALSHMGKSTAIWQLLSGASLNCSPQPCVWTKHWISTSKYLFSKWYLRVKREKKILPLRPRAFGRKTSRLQELCLSWETPSCLWLWILWFETRTLSHVSFFSIIWNSCSEVSTRWSALTPFLNRCKKRRLSLSQSMVGKYAKESFFPLALAAPWLPRHSKARAHVPQAAPSHCLQTSRPGRWGARCEALCPSAEAQQSHPANSSF